MRALSAVLVVLLGGGVLAPPAAAQTWEVAPTGIWQTQTSSLYWEQGATTTWGLRGSWLAQRNGTSRLRLDAGWTAPATWMAQGTDGSHAHLRAQSVSIGVGRETWFMEDRLCFHVALDLRNTWLESTQGMSAEVTNHLPQLWMRVGVGLRIWAFDGADRMARREPASYTLLRVELGEAAPRGPSTSDELLPQREVALVCGVRF